MIKTQKNPSSKISMLLKLISSLPFAIRVSQKSCNPKVPQNSSLNQLPQILVMAPNMFQLIWRSRCNNSLRVELLRIYEILLHNLHNKLLNCEPFLAPLVNLLNSFNGECLPVDIEKKLVILINQLCSSFSHHTELLNLFFPSSNNNEQSHKFR